MKKAKRQVRSKLVAKRGARKAAAKQQSRNKVKKAGKVIQLVPAKKVAVPVVSDDVTLHSPNQEVSVASGLTTESVGTGVAATPEKEFEAEA